MKDKSVDIYVYIQGEDGPDALTGLQKKLGHVTGIVRAGMNQYVRPLMSIEYDPDRISSQIILNMIRREGCNASLVGM